MTWRDVTTGAEALSRARAAAARMRPVETPVVRAWWRPAPERTPTASPAAPIYREILVRAYGAQGARRPSVDVILREVCDACGVSLVDLVSQRRPKDLVWTRHIAAYLCKALTPLSFPAIGRKIGNRDHTTIMNAVRRVADRMLIDPDFAAQVDALRRAILGRMP